MPDEILGGIVTKAKAAIKDGVDLLLMVVGAGASASVVEVVKSWLPEQTATMADETIAAAIGFALFYFGDRLHPRVPAFGLGVFVAGVGAWSSEWTSSIISMLTKK